MVTRVRWFKKEENKLLFIKWFHQYSIMSHIHTGDAYRVTLVDIAFNLDSTLGKQYEENRKSNN